VPFAGLASRGQLAGTMDAIRDEGDGVGQTRAADADGFELGGGAEASGATEAGASIKPQGAAFFPWGPAEGPGFEHAMGGDDVGAVGDSGPVRDDEASVFPEAMQMDEAWRGVQEFASQAWGESEIAWAAHRINAQGQRSPAMFVEGSPFVMQADYSDLGTAGVADTMREVADAFEQAAGEARDRRGDVDEGVSWVHRMILDRLILVVVLVLE